MSRMTKQLREAIIEAAMVNAYKTEFAQIAADKVALADKLYRHVISEEKEALLRQAGREFVQFTNNMHVPNQEKAHDGRWNHYEDVKLPEDRPVSMHMNGYHASLYSPKLLKQCGDLFKRQDELENKRDELRRQVAGLVESFTTIKQLHEKWPEGVKFIPSWAGSAKPLPLSVIPTKITELLFKAGSLPVEEAVPA